MWLPNYTIADTARLLDRLGAKKRHAVIPPTVLIVPWSGTRRGNC
jgi:hypothetical protein